MCTPSLWSWYSENKPYRLDAVPGTVLAKCVSRFRQIMSIRFYDSTHYSLHMIYDWGNERRDELYTVLRVQFIWMICGLCINFMYSWTAASGFVNSVTDFIGRRDQNLHEKKSTTRKEEKSSCALEWKLKAVLLSTLIFIAVFYSVLDVFFIARTINNLWFLIML